MHGHVSVTRCAALLTEAGDKIDRSALSRYCDTHGLKLPKVGKEVLVDFEAVQAHRSANYTRQVMSGGVEVPEATSPAPAAAAQVVPIPTAADPARELKQLQLRREQREEALAEGNLTTVAEVDAGAAEAIVEMRAAFAAARATEAEKLAAELGVPPEKVRIIRAGLKRYDRVGQDRFATRIAKALAEGNEGAGPALDRLNALAAHALRLRAVRQAETAAA
jgi:hypothetical protein